MKKKISSIYLWSVIAAIVLFVFLGSGYSYWNSASPDKTCASCHEIQSSVHSLSTSSHRNLKCSNCHGTALSNGIHSLKEKGMMVVNHVKEHQIETIRMNEEQLLAVHDKCSKCHSDEFAKWQSSGHSINYQHVFLNAKHNKTEQLNFDCLRCHGMFHSGTVEEIVEPIDKVGPWKMKDERLTTLSAIPCMACHQIHKNGTVAETPDYSSPKSIFYLARRTSEGISFYDRQEKTYIADVDLPELKLMHQGKAVVVSDDPLMRNCIQCHAPNAHHLAGTSDDRTPRGVHEGLSCQACHDPHSNDARESCSKCHPALSNCGLDVTKMNTTFADSTSRNNIHFVSCNDCHPGKNLN